MVWPRPPSQGMLVSLAALPQKLDTCLHPACTESLGPWEGGGRQTQRAWNQQVVSEKKSDDRPHSSPKGPPLPSFLQG